MGSQCPRAGACVLPIDLSPRSLASAARPEFPRGRQGSGMTLAKERRRGGGPSGPDQYCPPSRRVTAGLGRRERTGFKKLSSTHTRVDSLARSCGCSRLHFARRSHLPRQTITSSSRFSQDFSGPLIEVLRDGARAFDSGGRGGSVGIFGPHRLGMVAR